MRIVTREQAIAYRLHANHLVDRLPPGAYEQAAYVGLQDTGPRDALLGLHARMVGCTPDDWEHPALLQTYSPRAAVYVLPARDFGVFTLGRLPLDPAAVRRIDVLADRVCETLAERHNPSASGGWVRGAGVHGLRAACATGRIALRWNTTSLYAREVPRPALDVQEARLELCRRHVKYFGPTTPKTYAWWSGLRLFGRDRDARFIAPGLRQLIPTANSFHPHGLMINGQLAGAWGRKSNHVTVVLAHPLTPPQQTALEAETASLPLRNPQLSVR